jgi:GrpB-like predicted nucleotidyltransferase (UPF0157 family)
MSHTAPRMDYLEYDTAYPLAFEQLGRTIHSVVPDARIEHVGSTAVPGLGGRGTLDVVLLAEPSDHAGIVAALQRVGLSEVPYGAARPALGGSVQLDGRDYPVLLYVLPASHAYVRGWVAFRDFMLRHPEEIERYATIKKAAVAAGKTEPWSYQQAKGPYLAELAHRIDLETDVGQP